MVKRRKSPDLLVTHSPLFFNLTTDVLTCLAVSLNFTAIESYEVVSWLKNQCRIFIREL